MSPIRLVIRWLLTLLALVLASAALLLLALRLLLGQADRLLPSVEETVASRFGAAVSIERLDGRLVGLDPRLSVENVDLRARDARGDFPLLEIKTGELRLDTRTSLGQGVPVVDRARFQGVTLHLYQDAEGRWRWPPPARIPPGLIPETEFDLQRLDFWVGVLLRQRAWIDDLRLVLHGQGRTTVLHAPRLLMTGEAQTTHVEGEVYIEGRPDEAMSMIMRLAPGRAGAGGFSAALQASMRLGGLAGLVEGLGLDQVVRLEQASGEARLWGRWSAGRLVDARLDVQAPRLALERPPRPGAVDEAVAGVVIDQATLRGQWRRRGPEAWEAWLEGDVASAEWQGDDAADAPEGNPLPRYWHLGSRPGGWWANASGFELAALAQWRDRLRLPEGLSRAVDALRPRGQVTELGFGRLDGEWQARVAATGVVVSPWEQAPGGGPLDIWVESRGLGGRVTFVDSDGASLHFPTLFTAPMALDHASGRVDWRYDGPRSFVSGRGLRVDWNGAEVAGGFGLSIGGPSRGGFGLQLDFRDVDALSRPLTDWLPMTLLREDVDADLADWLASGLAGRVPQGALRLHVPVSGEPADPATEISPSLRLALEVTDGRLPFAPAWPALEDVSGRLQLIDETLTAEVDRAVSLGVEARDAEVQLVDETLAVDAGLEASGSALTRYLGAMPVEGMAAAEDWASEGRAEGRLALSLPLADPAALNLTVESRAELTRLTHAPTGLTFRDLRGPVAWRQQGEQGALAGRVEGRLLGGPLSAEIDTEEGGIALSGTAEAADLLALAAAPPGSEAILRGQLPWQGRLEVGEDATTLRLESALSGLTIDLPALLGKATNEPLPLRLEVALGDAMRLSGSLGRRLGLRWREAAGGQGQLWLGREAPVSWPEGAGWVLDASLPRLVPADWSQALAPLTAKVSSPTSGTLAPGIAGLRLQTDCLSVASRCLGRLDVRGYPVAGGWQLALSGSLAEGRVDYRPGLDSPLDIALDALSLDALVTPGGGGSSRLLDEVEVAPVPAALPDWLGKLPAGRLRIADLDWQARQVGPLTAYWRATPNSLTVEPVGLTLGQISARGRLVWETAGAQGSLSRARMTLDGRDIGTALEALDQPVAVRSASTRVSSQLAWPGGPWQFALARSQGSLDVALRDGRFANVESPSARLVGLLNVDNLLRRLRLDFSDVTGRGTAFDRVTGAATLYGGVLETRGPVQIEGPATRFTLDGSVDLVRRELDQRLGVTVPVSNNLPLAAVIAGAPVVGGALFIADKLFGDAIDRVTRIHYRVQGPWTSPRIALESAE